VVPSVASGSSTPRPPKKPTGRRDFSLLDLPEETVELVDAALEGKARRSGFEVSYRLKWRRGGMVRLKVMRAKYEVELEGAEDAKTSTAELPPEVLSRSLATPSLVARIAIEKHLDGMPLHRLEDAWLRDGVSIDRGTMSRWLGDVGALLNETVVAASALSKSVQALGSRSEGPSIFTVWHWWRRRLSSASTSALLPRKFAHSE
jgi:transposase